MHNATGLVFILSNHFRGCNIYDINENKYVPLKYTDLLTDEYSKFTINELIGENKLPFVWFVNIIHYFSEVTYGDYGDTLL